MGCEDGVDLFVPHRPSEPARMLLVIGKKVSAAAAGAKIEREGYEVYACVGRLLVIGSRVRIRPVFQAGRRMVFIRPFMWTFRSISFAEKADPIFPRKEEVRHRFFFSVDVPDW